MLKLKLEKRQMMMIGFGLIVVVAVLSVVFFYLPAINSSNKILFETEKLKKDILIAKDFTESQNKAQRKGRLISQQEIALAMDEITRAGEVQNINFVSIEPLEIEEGVNSKYHRLPIELKLVSHYKEIGQYMEALGQLNESIVSISSFIIDRDEDILPLVKTKMLVEVYIE